MADKSFRYTWAKAVAADRRMTPGQRLVLTRIAISYVTFGSDTFKVRQTTIARRCGVDVATVKRAYDKARQYGWLVLNEPRKRGPGSSDGNGYRLAIPDPVDNPELGRNVPPSIGAQDADNWGAGFPELGRTPNSSTSENGTPLCSLGGSSGGSAPATADAPHPAPLTDDKPPHRFCSLHPIGTPNDCRACRAAREQHEAWETRERQRRDERAQARVAAQQACTHCRYGWLLGDDGTELDPATRCHHCAIPEVTQGRSA